MNSHFSPPGKGSGTQLEEGVAQGRLGHHLPAPSPWCCSEFKPHRSSHCQGQIRCSWRLAPAATVLTPLTPHPYPGFGRQLHPWAPSMEPLSCLGLAGLKAGWESRSSDPVALATKHPTEKGKRREEGACGWAFGSSFGSSGESY